MEKYVIEVDTNDNIIFRNKENNLIYYEYEILKKIKELELKKVIIVYNNKNYDLALTNKSFYSRDIANIIIKSGNQTIITIDNTNRVWFENNWLKRLSNIIKSEQKVINDEVKRILEKNPNIINYSENQITDILNKEELKYPLESKETILEIRNKSIETKTNDFVENLYNSDKINNEIQNICTKFNNEELNKLIQIVNYKRKEILKKEIKAIIRLLAVILFTVIMKKFLPIGMFIPGEIILIGIAYASKTLNIKQLVVYFNQRKKLKEILNLIDNTKQEITLTKNNTLNNNCQEISKEDNQIRKDSYLVSLKECINLMAENPNIDWTTEKKKIMILAEGYTKYKKTSQLDNITLLQTCPTFMSELCDLEIAIKNKINANKKEDAYEEDLAEITTLLDNIKTPEMTLKLEKKL